MSTPITFTDGKALICALPSSKNGVYLVRVEPQFNDLVITHECPACRYSKRPCKHIEMAATLYYRWQWWEPSKPIHTVTRKIVLDASWQQIELPPSTEEQLRSVIRYAT